MPTDANPRQPSGAPTPAAWAQVHARDRVTRYRRSGVGGITLLLAADNDSGPWPGLETALAARCRVVAPELTEGAAPSDASLASFLEGLGAANAAVIVVHQPMLAPVLALAVRAPHLVRCVVVVSHGVESGEATAALHGEMSASVPMLVLAGTLPEGDAMASLTEFVCVSDVKRAI